MRYSVDTYSLRTTAADLHCIQATLRNVYTNVDCIRSGLSIRVRNSGDIDLEFRTLIRRIQSMSERILQAGNFLEDSASQYENTESVNETEYGDDSYLVSIVCKDSAPDVQDIKTEDSNNIFDFLSVVPIAGSFIHLIEASNGVMDGKGFSYDGDAGILGLFTLTGESIKSAQFVYDTGDDILELVGDAKVANNAVADFAENAGSAFTKSVSKELLSSGIFSLIINIFTNIGEGNTPLRTIEEIALETIIDVIITGLITVLLGSSPIGWGALALGIIIPILMDLFVSIAAGEPTSISEVLSDLILDAGEIVAEGIGNAIQSAGDVFSDISNGIAGWWSSVFA